MSHHPKTVLIIDDEEDLRDTVGYKFKAAGYTVVTAIDGVDGLEKLADLEPDLIILDVNMPRMNGLEFYQRIKGPDDRTKYPVLILTARANMENLFHDLDADGFMAKPFELDDLLQTAEQIILSNSGVLHNESTCGRVGSVLWRTIPRSCKSCRSDFYAAVTWFRSLTAVRLLSDG